MNRLCLVLFALMLAGPLQAGELLRVVSFSSARAGELIENEILRLSAAPDQPHRLLIEVEQPGITSPVYALRGMVRHEGVAGDAYLQMDSHFAGRGVFFTRSLAATGPLQKLTGSSDWRIFSLPFFANTGDAADGTALRPEKLSLSLYLPGSGTVYLRDVELLQYAPGEDPLRSGGQWISERTMAFAGAIGGTLVGLWGALIGFLAARGKARRFVLASANVLIALGLVSLGLGLTAFITGQPYAVYYALLLLGVILVLVVGGIRRVLPQRYEALELRKMQAMDT